MHKLEITIAPGGEVKVHIEGMKGKACEDVVEMFKKIVGPKKSQKWTSEYYEPDTHISRDIRRS